MTDSGTVADRIEVRRADITALDTDAIVNAANERMLGGGGVDGAIHRAAGSGLLEECKRVDEVRPGVRCPTGEARLTHGHELPARYVIHTVGPVWRGGTSGEPELLASCYSKSLQLAEQNELQSVAFPAISCGVYGYPLEEACAVAVNEVAKFLSQSDSIKKVVFAAFDSAVERALEKALRSESLIRHEGAALNPGSALAEGDRRRLLALVRQALKRHLMGDEPPDTEVESAPLQEHRAAFVTWRRRNSGELRGCIGEVIARRPLVESVVRMAVASGTQDPRFPPISIEELPDLMVEISALTPMKPIEPADVEVGRHGLMISRGNHSGLLLPQVPSEQGWNREEYLRGLCAKAGLPPDAWQDDDVELRSFEAEVWGEEE